MRRHLHRASVHVDHKVRVLDSIRGSLALIAAREAVPYDGLRAALLDEIRATGDASLSERDIEAALWRAVERVKTSDQPAANGESSEQ